MKVSSKDTKKMTIVQVKAELIELNAQGATRGMKADEREGHADRRRKILGLIVRDHAAETENYTAGWDVIVEAWSDEELAIEIGTSYTIDAVIKKIGKIVKILKAHEEEIVATADGPEVTIPMNL